MPRIIGQLELLSSLEMQHRYFRYSYYYHRTNISYLLFQSVIKSVYRSYKYPVSRKHSFSINAVKTLQWSTFKKKKKNPSFPIIFFAENASNFINFLTVSNTSAKSNSTYTDSLVSRQLNIFPIVEGSFQDETTTRHVSLYLSTVASLSSSRYLGPIYDAWANSIEGDSRVVCSGEV